MLKERVGDKNLARFPELDDAVGDGVVERLGGDISVDDAAQLGLLDLDMDRLEAFLQGSVGRSDVELAADIGGRNDREVAAWSDKLLAGLTICDRINDLLAGADAIPILAFLLEVGESGQKNLGRAATGSIR